MSKKKTEQMEAEQTTEASAENTAEQEQPQEGDNDLAQRLAEAEAKAQENWDQLLRTKAEMDNLRRRTERELENAHKYALERFAQDLLPVKDSLEMGLAAAQAEGADLASLKEGTELTLKILETAMEKYGIQAVHPVDEPFNPELHQAMSMLEMADKAPNTVVDVMQKGYTLNERLIRPALVVVSKAGSSEAAPEQDTNIDEQA